ncbi:MAG: preprotein translocase subunit SecE [Elusimicrobia bacterium]|nr:preprotein translocase subunit SecE [Elusimicrobiota bacterium]
MFNPVQFTRDAYDELQKVTWIPRSQMIGSTFIIMILVGIVSSYIAFVDFLVSQFFGIFIKM